MRCALAALALVPNVAAFTMSPAAAVAPIAHRAASPRLAYDHPAVQGWPEKYSGAAGGPGPRILHNTFAVQAADTGLLMELDVANWPTWTTAGNDRWMENVTRKDKEMPYGELSYISPRPHTSAWPSHFKRGSVNNI